MGGPAMPRSSNKAKQNDAPEPQSERPAIDNIVGTLRLENLFLSLSPRESGPLRISMPQQVPPELRDQFESVFGATLTPEDEEKIEKAAREVRPRFFQERFGNDAGR